jgi:hypothetical protein
MYVSGTNVEPVGVEDSDGGEVSGPESTSQKSTQLSGRTQTPQTESEPNEESDNELYLTDNEELIQALVEEEEEETEEEQEEEELGGEEHEEQERGSQGRYAKTAEYKTRKGYVGRRVDIVYNICILYIGCIYTQVPIMLIDIER